MCARVCACLFSLRGPCKTKTATHGQLPSKVSDFLGLLFGIWNCSVFLGNILGKSVSSAFVETDWSYCFYVMAGFVFVCAAMNFFFLVVRPEDVDCSQPKQYDKVTLRFVIEKKTKNVMRFTMKPVDIFHLMRLFDLKLYLFSVKE